MVMGESGRDEVAKCAPQVGGWMGVVVLWVSGMWLGGWVAGWVAGEGKVCCRLHCLCSAHLLTPLPDVRRWWPTTSSRARPTTTLSGRPPAPASQS